MRNPFARFFADKKPAEEAYASQRLMEGSGAWAQCNPSAIVGRQGLRVFSQMRKDDQIKAAMSFKKSSVLAPGWAIKSPEGMAEDWEPAAFIQWCLDNIVGTFDADLMEIMTALEYGFSVTEKLYAPVTEGEWAGKIKLCELKTKDPATFEIEADPFGTLSALYQIHGYKREPMTLGKFVIWAYQGEFGNWYGESDLEAAYTAWWGKTNTYKWMATALEKLAIPPIFALYNPGAYNDGLLSKLKTILARLQSNTTGQIPRPSKDDFEFWSPATTTAIKDVFIPALQMYNNDISRALLIPGLLGMTADSDTGSYSRSQTHFDAFSLVLDRIRQELAETVINEQIIRPLCDLNFAGLDDYPYFEFLPLTTDKRLDILSAWKQMLDARAVTKQTDDEEHIRSLLEFPERSEDNQVLPDQERDLPESPAPPRGEASPASDKGKPGRAFYSSFKLSRTPNRYEKKIDFKVIVIQLDEFEQGAKATIKASIKAAQESVAKKIKATFDSDPYALLEGLKFPNKAAVKAAVNELVDGAFANGRRSIAPGKYRDALPGVEAKEAIKWLRAKKIDIVGVLIDRVIGEVRAAITEAIRAGDTTQDAIERVKRILEPFTGDDAVLKDGEPLKPHRIETIVRTVTTQAFNMGRTVEMRQNPLVVGVQYSAILDERTTEVCAHLDGKIFRPGDSDLDALTPPNHYNCRSLLVPVMIDEEPKAEEFVTAGDVGTARDLAGKGFT